MLVASIITVIARNITALLSQTVLRLFRSTVALAEFIQLRIEAVFKLFDASIQIPYTLDKLLGESWGVFRVPKAHRRKISPLCGEVKQVFNIRYGAIFARVPARGPAPPANYQCI